MPWCAGCDRFLSPSTVTAAGSCPRCGATVDPGRARPAPVSEPVVAPDPTAALPGPGASTTVPSVTESVPSTTAAAEDEEVPLPIPWHFKMLVGAIALYLGWRAFQGIDWLVGRF